jgi:hypothetical protein
MAGTLKVGTITTPTGSGTITVPSGINFKADNVKNNYFRIYSSTATSVSDNTTTVIALQSSTYDTNNFHDTSNNRIKIPSGYTNVPFLITYLVRMNYDSIGDNTVGACRVNGSAKHNDFKFYAGQEGEVISYGGAFVYELSTDDYIDITMFQDSGSNAAKSNNTGDSNTFLAGVQLIKEIS